MVLYRRILSLFCLAFVAVVFLTTFPVGAQTEPQKNELGTPLDKSLPDELQLLKEEETVSIASRYEQPISEAPSNVYVITDEDIRNSGATDIPTLLRQVPGMEVMQVTGADFNVSVRGDNQTVANKLLVMVDGRSIYVDVQGAVYWKAIPVTLPEIKRIEVQKGPASVLYGFNAFDGVINIVTKSPQEMKGAMAQFGGGAYGTISSAAVYANSYKNLGLRLSYGHDQNQQWRNGSALAYRDNKFNIQTDYALGSDSKLTFSGGLVDVNKFDGFVSSSVVETSAPTLSYAHATYERPNFFVRAFWNSYNHDGPVIINPSLAPFLGFSDRHFNSANIVRGHTYNIETQHSIEFEATTRLSYGLNYRYNTLSSNFIDHYRTENRVGLYVQGEWKPSHLFQLVGGARYDLDTFINPTISPRGSLLFTPIPNHSVRATITVGYRPPTLFETYDDARAVITLPNPLPSPPPTSVQGSNSLQPEKIVSYELEYQGWYLEHRLRGRAALFYNHVSDLITFGRSSITQAGGVADIYGGETGLELLATKWLSGFGNVAYQEIGQTLTETSQRAGPRFKYNAGLRAQWDNGLSGELTYHWVGAATYPLSSAFSMFSAFGVIPPDPHVGHYELLNLRGAYRFWQEAAEGGYRREAEVAVSAFNALNDTHKEHPLGDLIGSRVMSWLMVRY